MADIMFVSQGPDFLHGFEIGCLVKSLFEFPDECTARMYPENIDMIKHVADAFGYDVLFDDTDKCAYGKSAFSFKRNKNERWRENGVINIRFPKV